MWYVERKTETDVAMRRWTISVSGNRNMGIPKLRWRDVLRTDMDEKGAYREEDRRKWRVKTRCGDHKIHKEIGPRKVEENIRYLQNTMNDAILRSTNIHDYKAHCSPRASA